MFLKLKKKSYLYLGYSSVIVMYTSSFHILYFFYQHIIILFLKKYCFSILFHHIVRAMEHDWKPGKNKTLVGSGGGNCFRFFPGQYCHQYFPATSTKGRERKHKNAVVYYEW
jgi:hypothetical protein